MAGSRRRVRLGRALRYLPAFEAAWVAGDVTKAHVRAVLHHRNSRTEAAMARDEDMLVEFARRHGFAEFARSLDYWALLADPDGKDRSAQDLVDARQVRLRQIWDGSWFGTLELDPIGGSVFAGELARREKAMFEEEWAEATAELGHKPTVADLRRTPLQRRADALVEMAIRSASMPPGSRRPAPLFTVLVGYETLHGRICELAHGTVVAPAAVMPWLDQALIERVVFGPDSRVMDVGVTRRLFTGATRRAVEVRDRWCYHETCDVPADECQIDHVIPAEDGGPTSTTNGRPACGFHNRARQSRPPP